MARGSCSIFSLGIKIRYAASPVDRLRSFTPRWAAICFRIVLLIPSAAMTTSPSTHSPLESWTRGLKSSSIRTILHLVRMSIPLRLAPSRRICWRSPRCITARGAPYCSPTYSQVSWMSGSSKHWRTPGINGALPSSTPSCHRRREFRSRRVERSSILLSKPRRAKILLAFGAHWMPAPTSAISAVCSRIMTLCPARFRPEYRGYEFGTNSSQNKMTYQFQLLTQLIRPQQWLCKEVLQLWGSTRRKH